METTNLEGALCAEHSHELSRVHQLPIAEYVDTAPSQTTARAAWLVLDLDHLEPEQVPDTASALINLAGPGRPILIGTSSRPLAKTYGPLLAELDLTLADGPAPWCVNPPAGTDSLHTLLPMVLEAIHSAPTAARMLMETLSTAPGSSIADALRRESMAYSLLLNGAEFARWRTSRPVREVPRGEEPVVLSRTGSTLLIELNRPERRNAWGHQLRDEFLEALQLVEFDHEIDHVVVSGRGPIFCAGGDLDEFGSVTDQLTAHRIRTIASAGWAVSQLADRLGDRFEYRLHGRCIGAGIEVPAFAARLVATPDTLFQLPELTLGLLPGAGGTVSIPRRIGRWRTAWWALTGTTINTATALEWGLIDDVC